MIALHSFPGGSSVFDSHCLSFTYPNVAACMSGTTLHSPRLLPSSLTFVERTSPRDIELQALEEGSRSSTDSDQPSSRLIRDTNNDTISLNDPVTADGTLSPGPSRMQRQTRARAAQQRDSEPPGNEAEKENGNANGNGNGNMTFPLEHRRKPSGLDGGSAFQTSQLMSMRGFSLDDDPPTPRTPGMPPGGIGFWELPAQDRSNFLLLVVLYFLQGIPMGLATGSVPFLLKSHLSYGQIGVFSLASYPYSLKLLWSPIVDAVWTPKLGRRKSWILPVQTFSGIGMIYLASRVDRLMVEAGANNGAGVWGFTVWWFLLVFTCATQDIAVDGETSSGPRC